jgi:uncharacterized protein YkwD
MLCLFLLKKADVMESTRLFFGSIGDKSKLSNNTVEDNNFDTTLNVQKPTIVKAYVQEPVLEKPKSTTAKISVDGIIYYTNIERQKAGLKQLIKNEKLNKSASEKVDDMFTKQYFEHKSPDGKTAADLVDSLGYGFKIVGENLALGIFSTDKVLVQAWMDSPTHRANILNPKYTEMGASVGVAGYKGQRQWMAVQHFAKPIPLCDEIDTTTQDNINTEKTALEGVERELQKRAGVIESDPLITKDYINEYNAMVAMYNERLNKLRDIITDFNKTIVDYNTCVKA